MNISDRLASHGWVHLQNVGGISNLISLLPNYNVYSIKTIKCMGSTSVEHSSTLVPPHTDVFWRPVPPRYLLLFCESPAPEGGESLLIGNVSRCISPNILGTLKTENIIHHRCGRNFTYRIYSDNIIRIPHNYRSIEHVTSSHFIDAWSELVIELKKNVHKIKLEAGDGLIVDNHTSLHGRLGFSNTSNQTRVLHKALLHG